MVTFKVVPRKDWWLDPCTDAEEPLLLDENCPICGEVTDDPLGSVQAYTPESHGNLVYIPPSVLHDGRY